MLEQGRQKCQKLYVETTIGGFTSPRWQITDQILKELYDPFLKGVKKLTLRYVQITASISQLLTAIAGLKNLRILRIWYINLLKEESVVKASPWKSLDIELDILEYHIAFDDDDYDEVENGAELVLALLSSVRWIKSLSLYMGDVNFKDPARHIEVLKICEARSDAIYLEKLSLGYGVVADALKFVDSPKLAFRELEIHNNFSTTESWVDKIELNTMPALKSLILSGYCKANEYALIFNHTPNLQQLQIFFNFGRHLHELLNLESLKTLKYLQKLEMYQNIGPGHTVNCLVINPFLELERLEHLSLNLYPHHLRFDEITLAQRNCLANLKTFSVDNWYFPMNIESIETLGFLISGMDSLEDFSIDPVSEHIGVKQHESIKLFLYFSFAEN
jgi:hypothetical protein